MSNIVLSRSTLNLRTRSILLPHLYPSLYSIRAASINSAINRGLRRSKGVGFRGKDRTQARGTNSNDGTHDGSNDGYVRNAAESVRTLADPRSQFLMTRDGWEGRKKFSKSVAAKKLGLDLKSLEKVKIRKGKQVIPDPVLQRPKKMSRAARFYDPNSTHGKKSAVFQTKLAEGKILGIDKGGHNSGFVDISSSRKFAFGDDAPVESKFDRGEDGLNGRRSGVGGLRERRNTRRGQSNAFSQFYSTKPGQLAFGGKRFKNDLRDEHQDHHGNLVAFPRMKDLPRARSGPGDSEWSASESPSMREKVRRDQYGPSSSGKSPSFAASRKDTSFNTSKLAPTVDKRIPASIPYTTSASEFLYGTSVVEAALTSGRIPRRKLYKLYIYAGENREDAIRDGDMERLAKKNGVEVVRVSADWLRIMDKMSGGRPHNGYILEASPLPRLPITSLGEVTPDGEFPGFKVVLDYQSREDADINGTSDFIRVPRNTHGRQPFVLLLDGIVDPGNLGGIIRTASFLGVTAIAISTRNSASFTPVVLKASAGASENITLFSINKPSGFIADSKLAGWKIYAAVAPSGRQDSKAPASVSTDDLDEPLKEDPCILMLGSEGEGLRKNLRSHANVELSIQGSGRSGSVDSLNVSVATGILCNAFLRRRSNFEKQKLRVESIQPISDPNKLF